VRCGGEVCIDRKRSRIALSEGTRLDLGGIAKGHAADRVSAALAEAGPCLVSAGGDISVRGEPNASVWAVAVPIGDGKITVGLTHGGLATSGVDRRCWQRRGIDCHHIIDPAIGLPAVTDLLRVTVVAASAREAEILATSLLLAAADSTRQPAEPTLPAHPPFWSTATAARGWPDVSGEEPDLLDARARGRTCSRTPPHRRDAARPARQSPAVPLVVTSDSHRHLHRPWR
jgi:hypothetical protein